MTMCTHFESNSAPISLDKLITHELILDEHLGVTDSICRCVGCGHLYLLELLDILTTRRLFRISPIDQTHGQRLLKNMANGSCDLNRAQNEIHTLKTQTNFADVLVELDTQSQQAVLHSMSTNELPTAHWRELCCDGSWFRAL